MKTTDNIYVQKIINMPFPMLRLCGDIETDVRPDEELELKVIYEAYEAGRFIKTVTVHCNAKDSPIRLRIKGNAE